MKRVWTNDERAIVLDRTDLTASEIGLLVDRSPGSVLSYRSFIKRGGGSGDAFWSEDEDEVIRSLSGIATADVISQKLPGRSLSAVKQRRLRLGLAQPPGVRLSPFLPAARSVLAKTCTSCGVLHDGANYRRNQGGGKYLSSSCLHCLSEKASAYKTHTPKKYPAKQAVKRDWRSRIQSETAKVATRNRYPYIEADFEVLRDPSLTLLAKALKLRRTYKGVAGICQSMKFESSGHLLKYRAPAAWSIDNPNANRVDEITAALKQEFTDAGIKFPQWDWDDEDLKEKAA